MNFLSAIGVKDYLYGAAIAALIAGGLYFVHHERLVGEDKIIAADTRTAAVAVAKDKAIEAAAQAAANTIGATYEKAVSVPAVGDIDGLVCRNTAPRSGVSQAADYRPANPGSPDIGSQVAFNPSGLILTVGRDDDAQINALIDQVDDLESRMNGSTK